MKAFDEMPVSSGTSIFNAFLIIANVLLGATEKFPEPPGYYVSYSLDHLSTSNNFF